MSVEMLSGYLSPSQAARVAGIDTGTLKYYTRVGKLAALMVPPGRRLYREADIQQIALERAEKGKRDEQA